MILKAVFLKVHSLLKDNPLTRDDDRLLMKEIWSQESKSSTLEEFFEEFLSGKLSHPESIRRVRQKIQENNPKLRGDKWESRHRVQGLVITQLTFFDSL